MRGAFANEVISPLTEAGSAARIPADLDAPGAVQRVQAATQGAYDRVMPDATVRLDLPWADRYGAVAADRAIMPADAQDQFDRILQDRFAARTTLGPDGPTLDGEALQKVHADLDQQGQMALSAPEAGQNQMGDSLLRMRDDLRDIVSRQNPDMAEQLAAANNAYAGQVRLQRAVAAAPDGAFNPADLAQAIRAGDGSTAGSAYAAGDDFMKDWADNAEDVLGSTGPPSATVDHEGVSSLVKHGWDAVSDPASLAGALAAFGPYTKTGMNAAQVWMNSGPRRQAFAKAIRMARPLGSLAGQAAGLSLAPQVQSLLP